MPFLHPAIAWSALGLASIPIIIHILNRRRLRKLDWAAMEFLLAALKRTRRRIRIEQLILLALRVALMVLLALLLARPMLSDQRFGWLASALQERDRIYILDDSLSMRRREAGTTNFEKGVEVLAAELDRLGQGRSRDHVLILRPSRPEAAIRGSFLDPEQSGEIQENVRALEPASTRLELAAVLERLTEETARTRAGGVDRPRSVAIITDLRATDWTDGAGGPSASLEKALRKLAEAEENPAEIVVFDVASDDTANVAVTEVTVEGGRPTVGIPTELRVQVRNFGRQPVERLRVQMAFGHAGGGGETGEDTARGTVLGPVLEAVGAGETATVSLACTFHSPGQYWAAVEVSGSEDALPDDNRLHLVLDVVEAAEVLVVSGEPSSEPWEGETDYLANALDPGGETAFGVLPVVTREDTLPRAPLESYDAVFLANVYSLPEDFRRRLASYVRGGGSLVVFLGDQVDAAVWGRELGALDGPPSEEQPWRGILPARLVEVVNAPEPGVRLRPSYDHPLFRLLKDQAEPYLDLVAFRRYWRLEPVETARTVAAFSDSGQSPAILEGTAGNGRVILFATSADAEWHDWPPNGTYPILIRQMMESLGRTRGRARDYLAGQPIEIPIDIAEHKLEARFRTPEYPETPEGTLRASPRSRTESEFRLLFEPRTTLEAGILRVGLVPRGGSPETAAWQAVAIRSDPAESDLTRLDPAQLRELYKDIPLAVTRESARLAETGRGRFEIADILLSLFAAVLFIEGVLACWFARHERSRSQSEVQVPIAQERAA